MFLCAVEASFSVCCDYAAVRFHKSGDELQRKRFACARIAEEDREFITDLPR